MFWEVMKNMRLCLYIYLVGEHRLVDIVVAVEALGVEVQTLEGRAQHREGVLKDMPPLNISFLFISLNH